MCQWAARLCRVRSTGVKPSHGEPRHWHPNPPSICLIVIDSLPLRSISHRSARVARRGLEDNLASEVCGVDGNVAASKIAGECVRPGAIGPPKGLTTAKVVLLAPAVLAVSPTPRNTVHPGRTHGNVEGGQVEEIEASRDKRRVGQLRGWSTGVEIGETSDNRGQTRIFEANAFS